MALSLKTNIIIISVIFSIIPTLSVALRLRARMIQRMALSKDDYMVIPGLIFSLALSITQIVAVVHGNLGGHIHMDENGIIFDRTLTVFLQTEWISQWLSVLSLVFTKLSIVLFYRRIFRGKLFSLISLTLLGVISIWGISFFFATIFECMPVRIVWQTLFGTPEHQAYCYDAVPMFIATAITNMIVDTAILSVPIPIIWGLNMPTKQKFALSGIFLLGAFVIGISIARIYFFYESTDSYQNAFDITTNIAPTLYWTMLEAAIAVTCACMPTLRPLFSDLSLKALLSEFASRFTINSSSATSQDRSAARRMGKWGNASQTSAAGIMNKCEATRLSSTESYPLELQGQSGIAVRQKITQSEYHVGTTQDHV
ncbi:hypothetical protein F5Y11DRAFT_321516 [Daldinia sp. FL1419]|nr:hypothetical protein F5Y11DRAFT_321516 [Daldinia sp. FL1419]